MHCSPARWTTAAAAAALMALPLTATAQTPPPATSPTQQTAPQQPPAQPPADPSATSAHPAAPQVDASAAKLHLSEARDTLSQLTSLPEAARLQGDARTQVSQLISNFNELITTQADWRAAYSKVDANLTTLLGPESSDPASSASAAAGVAGAVGTTGTSAAPAAGAGTATGNPAGSPAATAAGAGDSKTQIDPAIRAKLVEFRTHLKEFEKAAGSNGAMAPGAATGTTTNPASPTNPSASPATTSSSPAANPADPSNPANPASAGAGSSAAPTPNPSSASASPTANMAAGDQAKATAQVGHADADKELDAISAILAQSKTGTMTKSQTAALKKHVEALRQLLQQSK